MTATPEARVPGPDTPFEIGLVMAGAISAGAYTAGVVDFLIEALDEWQAARGNAPDCPPHEVRLKVMAGASAGGMTAALAAGLLGMKFETVTRQPAPDGPPATPLNNNLYRSWVNTIDIQPLLGTADLDGDGKAPVQSLLDSSILKTIAADAFRFEAPEDRMTRPYLADPLHVVLTVTNLRGVPYAPEFANWPKLQPYEMTMHADNMHFVLIGGKSSAPADAFGLTPYNFADPNTWGVLQTTALATGAFPVGLAPRLLKRRSNQYDLREWRFVGPHEVGGVHFCEYWQPIPPAWPPIGAAVKSVAAAGTVFEYEFLCVDGGVMNNEPLDLARRILAGPQGDNPRAGDKATRAVVMVLPFPNNMVPDPGKYDGRTTLFRLLTSTFNSLISQARFHPGELAEANNPDVYSRFLVVPRRGHRADGSLEPYTIACGSLGGFGGFLSRRFREHDYQLGRRNCQRFLKEHFVLPSEGEERNKLFDHWNDAARNRHRVVQRDRQGAKGADATGDLSLLPIIPLMGKAAVPIPDPTWPKFTAAEFAALRFRVKTRLLRVATALIDQNIGRDLSAKSAEVLRPSTIARIQQAISDDVWGPLARVTLKLALWLRGGAMIKSIMETIRDDLTKRKLMDEAATSGKYTTDAPCGRT